MRAVKGKWLVWGLVAVGVVVAAAELAWAWPRFVEAASGSR